MTGCSVPLHALLTARVRALLTVRVPALLTVRVPAVVSHNQIENIDCVKDLKNLTKISASHNKIRSLDCLQVMTPSDCF